MDVLEIEDAEWRELPELGVRQPADEDRTRTAGVPAAIRARARLAQSVALRAMESSWSGGGRVISAPAPRLRDTSSSHSLDGLWLASCGGSRSERARAAEALAIEAFLARAARPRPRSI
jgi:hypothetical protein